MVHGFRVGLSSVDVGLEEDTDVRLLILPLSRFCEVNIDGIISVH